MREYWGSQFALDKYTGTNGDTYIWPLGSIPPSSLQLFETLLSHDCTTFMSMPAKMFSGARTNLRKFLPASTSEPVQASRMQYGFAQ